MRLHYPSCRTTRDKEELAERLGISDEHGKASVAKLYNLASRLKCTQGHDQDERADAIADESRLHEREDPATTEFTAKDDRYLKAEFGRRTPEAISYHVQHTETAMLYRARKLGLRKPAKHWNAVKVARWFGFSLADLYALRDEGVDIYPCYDKRQPPRLQIEVVSTTSLWRWLEKRENRERLLQQEADRFFLLELRETKDEIVGKPAGWESCQHLSYGHICQNPRAETYGLYCTNNDKYAAGEDPKCFVRMMDISELRPVEEIS